MPESLNKSLVTGKIVLCDQLSEGDGAAIAGAIGTIMQDVVYKDFAFSYQLPATYLSLEDGGNVSKYINTTRSLLGFLFLVNLYCASNSLTSEINVVNWTEMRLQTYLKVSELKNRWPLL